MFDPDETNNINDREDMAEIRRGLCERLDAWMEETKDPLLPDGHVAAPSGSRVNDSDDRSPKDVPEVMPQPPGPLQGGERQSTTQTAHSTE